MLRGFACPSPGKCPAQREKRRFQERNRQRNGFAREGWNPALELGGEIPGWQRQAWEPSALDELDEIRHQAEQFVLKRYCRLQLRPKSKKSRPSIGRGQVAGLASGLGQRDVRHGSSMV